MMYWVGRSTAAIQLLCYDSGPLSASSPIILRLLFVIRIFIEQVSIHACPLFSLAEALLISRHDCFTSFVSVKCLFVRCDSVSK